MHHSVPPIPPTGTAPEHFVVDPLVAHPGANPQTEAVTQVFQTHMPSAVEQPTATINASLAHGQDAIFQLRMCLQQIKAFSITNWVSSFANVIKKIAEQQIEHKDHYSLLSIFHVNNLAFFQSLPDLPDATKKNMLVIFLQIARLEMQEGASLFSANGTLPFIQWLFECQTGLLSLDDEKSLAFYIMFAANARNIKIDISLFNAILKRWQAWELSQNTILVVLGLVALSCRSLNTSNIQDALQEEGQENFLEYYKRKLDSISDPTACRAIIVELLKIQEIHFFPPVLPEAYLRAVFRCYQRGLQSLDKNEETLVDIHLVAIITFLMQVTPIYSKFRRQFRPWLEKKVAILSQSAWKNPNIPLCHVIDVFGKLKNWLLNDILISHTRLLFHTIAQRKLSMLDLQSLFASDIAFMPGNDEQTRVLMLQLIKNVEPELHPVDRVNFENLLKNFRKILDFYKYKPSEVKNLLSIIVNNFFSKTSKGQEFYKFFSYLQEYFTNEENSFSFSLLSLPSVGSYYRQQAIQPCPEAAFGNIYSLLVLALLIPQDEYIFLARQFLQSPDETELSSEQIHEFLFTRLDQITRQASSRYLCEIDSALNIVLCLLERTSIPVHHTQSLLSYLILLLLPRNDTGANTVASSSNFVKISIGRVIESGRLPALTKDADRVLEAWLGDLSTFTSISTLANYAESQKLKIFLPRNVPDRYAQQLLNAVSMLQFPEKKRRHEENFIAIASLVRNGYLTGVSKAYLFGLQKTVVEALERLIHSGNALAEKHDRAVIALCSVIKALCKEGLMDHFYDPSKKEAFMRLYEAIEKSFLRRLR